MSTKEKPKRVPRFKSYEEEAEFWDAHSPEDFPDEFEDVEVEFASSLANESNVGKRRELINALSGLPDDERQVLTMILLGLSAAEIARVTGWSENKCRRAMDIARQRAGRLIGR